MLKLISSSLLSVFILSGCSINIGGSQESSSSGNVIYDCSELSESTHKEMTKRYLACSDISSIQEKKCYDQVIESVCKPIPNANYQESK